jgi:hypothetical protein
MRIVISFDYAHQLHGVSNMKAVLFLGILLLPVHILAYENIHDVVRDSRNCWFEDQKGFTCEFVIGENLKFVMVDVGGPETTTLVQKSDSENGKYYLNVNASHNCLIIGDQASQLFQGGFAYISPKNAKVYKNAASCVSGLRELEGIN